MTARKYVFFDVGFHGDRHLISVVSEYLTKATHFVETGTNVASTLQYTAKQFSQLDCHSCEPDPGAHAEAVKNCGNLQNVSIQNTDSLTFLANIKDQLPARGQSVVCWLDAHGHGFQWPLREEIAFFTEHFPQAAVFVDDFKVPDQPEFGFDQYETQECSFEFIRDHIRQEGLQIVYPTYSEHTSTHHPLRGWCLIRPANRKPGEHESRLSKAFDICEMTSV